MNHMPPKVIGRYACLYVRDHLGLSKGLGTCDGVKLKKKQTKEFMKVGEGGVQHNRYNGHWM